MNCKSTQKEEYMEHYKIENLFQQSPCEIFITQDMRFFVLKHKNKENTVFGYKEGLKF